MRSPFILLLLAMSVSISIVFQQSNEIICLKNNSTVSALFKKDFYLKTDVKIR